MIYIFRWTFCSFRVLKNFLQHRFRDGARKDSYIPNLGGVVFGGQYNIKAGLTNILGHPVCALIQSKILSTCMLVKR